MNTILVGTQELTPHEYLNTFQKRTDKNLTNLLIEFSTIGLGSGFIDYEPNGMYDRIIQNINSFTEIVGQEEYQFVEAWGKNRTYAVGQTLRSITLSKLAGKAATSLYTSGLYTVLSNYISLDPKYYSSLTTGKIGVTFAISDYKSEYYGKIINPIKVLSHNWDYIEDTSGVESYAKTYKCSNCGMKGTYVKDQNRTNDKKYRRLIIPSFWLDCDEYIIADILQ